MPRTRLKVCCISSRAEAQLAIAHGADALGLVGTMPSGPGPIPDDLIADIARAVPPPIATFLLTSEVDPDAVVAHVRRAHVNTVQLVDDETQPDVYRALTAAPHVDALLLDSGNPGAQIRELGGTGRTHNWDVSRTIVERSPVPVFLAGGLRADNIASAVAAVRPYGVDLCSGVRTNGALDAAKLDRFVTRLRATAG